MAEAEQTEKADIIIAARERGPGPGRYALPSTFGFVNHDPTKYMKPAYSFGQRLTGLAIMRGQDNSPGPAYFVNSCVTRHGKDGTPSYSMLGRQRDPKNFKTPSPGRYSPEKVHPQGERHAAAYSMGARTRFRKRDSNPAPSRYALPPLLGSWQPSSQQNPSYSMNGRTDVGSYCEDLSKTPGPGQYNAVEPNIIRSKMPVYSLKARSQLPGDSTQKPGPGQHSPEKVTLNKPSPPIHSLGIRHSEFVTPLLIDVAVK